MTTRVILDPPEYKLVDFDPAELTALIEGLLDAVGLDRPVTLEVDQTTPLGHTAVKSIDPVVLWCDRCEREGQVPQPSRLRCPTCGEPSARVVGGRELELVSVEVIDGPTGRGVPAGTES